MNGITDARMVLIDDITLSGENMREDVGDIAELAESIRKHGILQPLLVTKRKRKYLLVCGHRRLAAARRAGLLKVPIVARELTDDERLELMIVENVHRKHLSPLEEAHAFEKLMERGDTQDDVAARIGKSQTYVSFRISLLKCDEDIQQRVHKGELSLQRAIETTRDPYGPHAPKMSGESNRAPANVRWQIYYIDRLVGWLETGRIPKDDNVLERLILLGRALKAFSQRLAETKDPKRHDGDDPNIVANIPMCNHCGTVVGVGECCKEHGQMCETCKEEEHGEAA